LSEETWSLVDVLIDTGLSELVADALWALGVVAIEEIAHSDGTTTLRTSMGDSPFDFADAVRELFPFADVTVSQHDREVADTWRQFAETTWVTDTVALVPAWRDPPPDCIPVFVEPFDTFGLGNHPTTILTLRLALKHSSPGSTAFDFGSGSGVLAVALAKVAGCKVLAFDIAQSATRALRQNMSTNNVSTCEWVDGFPQRLVDMVMANILAPVLESEAESITDCLLSGGVAVLSGMRDEQCDRVLKHYEGFTEIERESVDGWCAVALRKK
jgi:ribosomal protein L11 methyltransferase